MIAATFTTCSISMRHCSTTTRLPWRRQSNWMKSAKLKLTLAAAAFAFWIVYLIYLVLVTNRPVVHWWPPSVSKTEPEFLSRPQFLLSQIDVVAQVDDVKGPVVVREVLYPHTEKAEELINKTIQVEDLAKCGPLPTRDKEKLDWTGPGLYILPLVHTEQPDVYRVALTGRSPGYPPHSTDKPPPRIYPA